MRNTIDRTHYEQSMTDIRIAANTRGLTQEEAKIAESIYDSIPHYRAAAKKLTKTEWLTICHLDYSQSLYRWDGTTLKHIATTSKHRINQIITHYDRYLSGDIHPDIWDNYCNGGFMTKRGLSVEYKDYVVDRIQRIAMSHFDCDLGGKLGHDIRVSLRN